MVLSNKKLKQRIRENLFKSLSVSVAETYSQSQSLKELLDSASHKPRLSKREKRRNSETCASQDEPNGGIGIRGKEVEGKVENGGTAEKTDKKNRKKRKRDDTKQGELEGDEGTKERQIPQKKMKQKKKKKKKKKIKASITPKKAEEDKVEENLKVVDIQVDSVNKEEEGGTVPNKLYVGGIPYKSTEDEIRSYFRSCGVITKVDCKMRSEDGAFSGIAFITFESEDGVKRALAFDRAEMGDRYLTIQQYVKTTTSIPRTKASSGFVPEMVDGYNRVYIGNLAWDTTERDIRKLFSDCVIISVRLGKNKETGEFKGYAHVDFKDSVSVVIALKLDQQVICGRPVKICCALKEGTAAYKSTDHTRDESNNGGSYNMEETYTATDPLPASFENGGNNRNYFPTTVSSGKVKRRVCYECGEKGHLSTACPKKLQNADNQGSSKLGEETVDARLATQNYAPRKNYGYMNETYAATNEANNGSLASTVSTGKVKRRNCYECGEKGHLSTACPKKLQNTAYTNSKLDYQTVEPRPTRVTSYNLQNKARDSENNGGSYVGETYATGLISTAVTNEANDGNLTPTVSIGKIKRRNCYECGEKGHLSSACPKKLQKQG